MKQWNVVTLKSRIMTVVSATLGMCALVTTLQAQADDRPTEKEWTILTFMSGNNNLDDFGTADMNEMEQVGSTDTVNIVVQRGSAAATKVGRYLIQQDSDAAVIKTAPIEEFPDAQADMGSVKTLKEFLKWGVKNFPAKHYYVNVWNHGAGWHEADFQGPFDTFLNPGMGIFDIAFDDKTGSFIKTEELGQALAEMKTLIGRKIDIYGSDACLMNMVEVGSEIADSVDIMVGSEEVEPVEGWPYDQWLKEWATTPGATPAQVAGALVRQYVASYSGGSQGTKTVQLSALDLSKTAALQSAVKAFAGEITKVNATQKSKLVKELNNVFQFAYSDYADLGDMLTRTDGAKLEGLDGRFVKDAQNALKGYVLANAGSGTYATSAKGASIWLPLTKYTYETYKARYKGLKFNQATGWGDALAFLMK